MGNLIMSCDEYEYDADGYRIGVYVIPPETGDNHSFPENFDDRSIGVPKDHGSVWARVYDEENNIVGNATLASDGNAVRCDSIDIDEQHRCKGLATTIYEAASHIFGCPVVPSDILSQEAKGFWGNRTQIT